MTVKQFGCIETGDTDDYELLEGTLVSLPSTDYRHNMTRDRLERFVGNYFETAPIGEVVGTTHCRVAPETVRRPDLSIFLAERLRLIDIDKIPVPIPPDIAVEVLSPSDSAMNVRRNVREYLHGGSKEVWLLDHSNGEIVIHTNEATRILEESDNLETPLLPGFVASVADLLRS